MRYILNILIARLKRNAVKSDFITLTILYEHFLAKGKNKIEKSLLDGNPLNWFIIIFS